MEGSLFEQGMELMLVGMGTVFVFLTLLVLATSAMSWVVMRYLPAPVAADAGPTAEEVAAISAAIVRHREAKDMTR